MVRVFSTTNNAKVAELRRGVDPAAIFSIRISPNNKVVAVTSDKSTLHVFDLPPAAEAEPVAPDIGTKIAASTIKWGFLGKIPFLPRAFSDTYSFASTHFDTDDDLSLSLETASKKAHLPIPGILGGRAPKGVIGWLDNETLVVVGGGRNGKWEKFIIITGEEGHRSCVKDGWRRYLG